MALQISMRHFRASASGILPFSLISYLRSPPLQYSKNIYKLFFVITTSYIITMLGQLKALMISISLLRRVVNSFGCWVIY
jgi:ABC-type phosphate/phosphonate transport system permease subunit